MRKPLPPVVNEASTVLILGSFPSEISLKLRQYYANPRNQFWKLVFAVYGEPTVPADYERRLGFLLNHGIALWDVIASCDREGSLDARIKHAVPNDFRTFLAAYPNIRCLAFNGSKSHEVFVKKVGEIGEFAVLKLPSSSVARTTPFEEKLTEWKKIKAVQSVRRGRDGR